MHPQRYLPTFDFDFDFKPSRIRPFNYERLVPKKDLTDKAIDRYILQGKYGPEMQKRALEDQKNKQRVKRHNECQRKVVEKILDTIGY